VLTSTGSGPGDYDWQLTNAVELQGVPVAAGTPASGDLLTYDGTEWVGEPSGGFAITSFAVTGGFGTVVEVGTSITDPTATIGYNETPDSATLTWTNPSGSEALTTPFTSGTLSATFTSATNGATSSATISATKDSSTPTRSVTTTWAGAVVAGPETDPSTPGQALWNALAAANKLVRTTIGGSFAISCTGSQIPTGAVLTSLGRLPTIKDQNGFTYPATSLGAATIAENGTSQNYTFFVWATDGADATFTFS
jgi:hypothetical protein